MSPNTATHLPSVCMSLSGFVPFLHLFTKTLRGHFTPFILPPLADSSFILPWFTLEYLIKITRALHFKK